MPPPVRTPDVPPRGGGPTKEVRFEGCAVDVDPVAILFEVSAVDVDPVSELDCINSTTDSTSIPDLCTDGDTISSYSFTTRDSADSQSTSMPELVPNSESSDTSSEHNQNSEDVVEEIIDGVVCFNALTAGETAITGLEKQQLVNTELLVGTTRVPVQIDTLLWEEVVREVHMISAHSYIPAVIGGTIENTGVQVLLDTGATVTLIGADTIRRIGMETEIELWNKGPVRAANGNSLQVMGTIRLELKIGPAVIICKAVVVQDLSRDMILGKDVLKLTRARLDMEHDTVTFAGCPPLPFGEAVGEAAQVDVEYIVCATEDYTIPPRSEAIIGAETVQKGDAAIGVAIVLDDEEYRNDRKFATANSLVQIDGHGLLVCAVVNTSTTPVQVKKGEILGRIEAVDEKLLSKPKLDDEARAHAFSAEKEFNPNDIKLGRNLTKHQRQLVHTLLSQYADVFQENLKTPGQLRVPSLTIDLVPGATMKPVRNFRKSEKEHDQIKTMMEDKVKKGVAERSNSMFAAPTMMVPKKDGRLRMVVDLRGLNAITVPVVQSMPRPDDMFAAVRGSAYFSLADATWGYWQMDLAADDRPKAAYSTREGIFQPTTMDFGMRNAPAIWQRAMNMIFDGLLWERCLIYMDDLLVYSRTFEQHMENLEQCLIRCRQHNLKLRPTKCLFFQEKIPFLGHQVSGDGVEMDAKKVQAIVDIPPPETATKLHSFVCMAQYYREFLRDFANIVRPLRELVVAPTYKWESIHQDAFQKVKELLLQNVVLAHPYPDKPFILECDASDYGLGYILAQRGADNRVRVIAFGSRALTPTERNYSATERECLAVVEGVKKYHIYLHGNKFSVVTDHKALQWLMNHKDPTSKLMRWALRLQEYQFEIQHRTGRQNANVDALSRLVDAVPRATMESIFQVNAATLTTTQDKSEDVAQAQWRDKELKLIKTYLESRVLPKDPTKSRTIVAQAQHMELIDDVLYHLWWPRNKRYWDGTRAQVAIPEAWREKVLQECHDSSLTGGHLGFTKTHLKLRDRYWWPTMYADTKHYVTSCSLCQRRKGAPSVIANEVWEIVGMDIFGPIKPVSKKGNRYIITFTDIVSKYVVAKCLKEATEISTAAALVKKIICQHSIMQRLISDRGTNFVSNMIMEVYKMLQLRKVNTTAWHPQGNGQTEQFNRPLADMLAIYVDGTYGAEWDEQVAFAIFAYNVSVHEATKFSPYFLMYGREPRFPNKWAMGTTNINAVGGYGSLAEEYEHRFKFALGVAKDNIQLAHHKMEVRGASTKKAVTYRVGDRVWLFVRQRTEDDMSSKLKLPWQGPYEVIKQVTPNVVSLRGLGGRLGQNVHVNRLKLYVERRPFTEPELDEEDEFDPTEEKGIINTDTLKEGEVQPQEEEEVDHIVNYKITQQGTVQYLVKWRTGDSTWEPEENVRELAALDKFLMSRRDVPLLGLRIQLERHRKLFSRRGYSLIVAIQQLRSAFNENCDNSPNYQGVLARIAQINGIQEARQFVESYLDRFKEETKTLTPKPLDTKGEDAKNDMLQGGDTHPTPQHSMTLRRQRANVNVIDTEEATPKRARNSATTAVTEVCMAELIPEAAKDMTSTTTPTVSTTPIEGSIASSNEGAQSAPSTVSRAAKRARSPTPSSEDDSPVYSPYRDSDSSNSTRNNSPQRGWDSPVTPKGIMRSEAWTSVRSYRLHQNRPLWKVDIDPTSRVYPVRYIAGLTRIEPLRVPITRLWVNSPLLYHNTTILPKDAADVVELLKQGKASPDKRKLNLQNRAPLPSLIVWEKSRKDILASRKVEGYWGRLSVDNRWGRFLGGNSSDEELSDPSDPDDPHEDPRNRNPRVINHHNGRTYENDSPSELDVRMDDPDLYDSDAEDAKIVEASNNRDIVCPSCMVVVMEYHPEMERDRGRTFYKNCKTCLGEYIWERRINLVTTMVHRQDICAYEGITLLVKAYGPERLLQRLRDYMLDTTVAEKAISSCHAVSGNTFEKWSEKNPERVRAEHLTSTMLSMHMSPEMMRVKTAACNGCMNWHLTSKMRHIHMKEGLSGEAVFLRCCETCWPRMIQAAQRLGMQLFDDNSEEYIHIHDEFFIQLKERLTTRGEQLVQRAAALTKEGEEMAQKANELCIPSVKRFTEVGMGWIEFSRVQSERVVLKDKCRKENINSIEITQCVHCRDPYVIIEYDKESKGRYLAKSSPYKPYCVTCLDQLRFKYRTQSAVQAVTKSAEYRHIVTWIYKRANMYDYLVYVAASIADTYHGAYALLKHYKDKIETDNPVKQLMVLRALCARKVVGMTTPRGTQLVSNDLYNIFTLLLTRSNGYLRICELCLKITGEEETDGKYVTFQPWKGGSKYWLCWRCSGRLGCVLTDWLGLQAYDARRMEKIADRLYPEAKLREIDTMYRKRQRDLWNFEFMQENH